MTLVNVGRESEFPEGRMCVVNVEGKDLGVLAWRGRWYALRNVCPHLGAPICSGVVNPFLAVGPDHYTLVVDDTRPVLMCPWHRWEFDLDSGRVIGGSDEVRLHDVQVVDGQVHVDSRRLSETATA